MQERAIRLVSSQGQEGSREPLSPKTIPEQILISSWQKMRKGSGTEILRLTCSDAHHRLRRCRATGGRAVCFGAVTLQRSPLATHTSRAPLPLGALRIAAHAHDQQPHASPTSHDQQPHAVLCCDTPLRQRQAQRARNRCHRLPGKSPSHTPLRVC